MIVYTAEPVPRHLTLDPFLVIKAHTCMIAEEETTPQ